MSETYLKLKDYLQSQKYQTAIQFYQNNSRIINKLTPHYNLLLAKAFFVEEKCHQAVQQLENIQFGNDLAIQYQTKILLYKAKYLIGQDVNGFLNSIVQKIKEDSYFQHHRFILKQIIDVVQNNKNKQRNLMKDSQIGQFKQFKQLMMEDEKAGMIDQGIPSFLVPQRWFKKWQDYVDKNNKEDKPHPGPITQFQLLDHPFFIFYDYQKQKSYTNYFTFKTSKYVLLSKKCWNFLYQRYNGIELKRWNISINDRTKQTMTEIHLKQIYIINEKQRQNFILAQITKKQTWKGFAKKIGKQWGQNGVICQLKDGKINPINQSQILEEVDTIGKKYIYSFDIVKKIKENLQQKKQIQKCANCKRTQKLKYCHCKLVKYCDMDCLKQHRQKHRKACEKQVSHIKQKSAVMDTFQLQQRSFGGRKGLVGLRNLGNTCYMNSGLQCLINTRQLTDYFMSNKFLDDINSTNPLGTKGNLSCAYAQLVRQMWTGKDDVISPFTLKKMIGKFAPQFYGFGQQDSQQFISYLIDGLQQDLNLVKNKQPFETKDDVIPDQQASLQSQQNYAKRIKSHVRDIMCGQFKSTVVCSSCNKISVCFDPYLLLSLPIPIIQQASAFVVLQDLQEPVYKITFPLKTCLTLKRLRKEISNFFKNKQLNPQNYKFKILNLNTCQIVKQISESEDEQFYDIFQKYKSYYLFCYEIPQETSKDTVYKIKYFYQKGQVSFPRFIKIPNETNDEQLSIKLSQTLKRFVKKDPKGYLQSISGKTLDSDGFQTFKLNLNTQVDMLKYTDQKDFGIPQFQSKNFTLNDCLEAFSHKQLLQKDNQCYCNKCKEFKPATKTMQIYKANKIVVLAFKRFNRFRKVRANITYPIQNVDLGPFIKSNKQKKPILYDLYGVVNHYGSLGGGHYTAYCKNFIYNKWFQFNDSRVSQINLKQVVHQDAYVLFFRRKD